MSRLVVVSNRVTVATDKKARAGGLAVALQESLQQMGGLWFGWSGKTMQQPDPDPVVVEANNVTYATVHLGRAQYNDYYNGFANRVLWPLFHLRTDLTAFRHKELAAFFNVNRLFADKLTPLLKDDDRIWVHDYHLIPLGEELRRRGFNRPLGFFLHTPWPAMEILLTLPAHNDLVRGLAAYDLIGFHTANDLRAFLDYIVHEAGGEVLGDKLVCAYGRTFKVDIFPIGINVEEYARAGLQANRRSTIRRLQEANEGRSWVIGVDRLDYSKGIPERFRSFARFLRDYPANQGRTTLLQIAPPSRAEVPEYKKIRADLEALAGAINGELAEVDWVPINYINKSFNRDELAALYRSSRIGLVTPLRDGMNLVAKEYVAAQNPQDPGVLVLSRFAGAARELDSALIVNPFDARGVAEAIAKGLEMSLEERLERWEAMMDVLNTNTLSHWRDSFLKTLSEAPFQVP